MSLPFSKGKIKVKLRQQRVIQCLQSKGVEHTVADLAEGSRNKRELRMLMMGKPAPPPLVFNGNDLCGDFQAFSLAVEDEVLEEFLQLEKPKPKTEEKIDEKAKDGEKDENTKKSDVPDIEVSNKDKEDKSEKGKKKTKGINQESNEIEKLPQVKEEKKLEKEIVRKDIKRENLKSGLIVNVGVSEEERGLKEIGEKVPKDARILEKETKDDSKKKVDAADGKTPDVLKVEEKQEEEVTTNEVAIDQKSDVGDRVKGNDSDSSENSDDSNSSDDSDDGDSSGNDKDSSSSTSDSSTSSRSSSENPSSSEGIKVSSSAQLPPPPPPPSAPPPPPPPPPAPPSLPSDPCLPTPIPFSTNDLLNGKLQLRASKPAPSAQRTLPLISAATKDAPNAGILKVSASELMKGRVALKGKYDRTAPRTSKPKSPADDNHNKDNQDTNESNTIKSIKNTSEKGLESTKEIGSAAEGRAEGRGRRSYAGKDPLPLLSLRHKLKGVKR